MAAFIKIFNFFSSHHIAYKCHISKNICGITNITTYSESTSNFTLEKVICRFFLINETFDKYY